MADECSICCQIKTDPVALNCGHTFCSHCIDNLLRIGNSTRCPLCRCPIVIDESEESQSEVESSDDAESMEEDSEYNDGDSESEEEVTEPINMSVHGDQMVFSVQFNVTVSIGVEESSVDETDEDEDMAPSSDESEESSDSQMDYEEETDESE